MLFEKLTLILKGVPMAEEHDCNQEAEKTEEEPQAAEEPQVTEPEAVEEPPSAAVPVETTEEAKPDEGEKSTSD